MDRDLLRRLLAAGVFFGLVFGLAFLSGAEGSSLAPLTPVLEGEALR
ncbi:hypothetical protein [Phenylobacterium sp.]